MSQLSEKTFSQNIVEFSIKSQFGTLKLAIPRKINPNNKNLTCRAKNHAGLSKNITAIKKKPRQSHKLIAGLLISV